MQWKVAMKFVVTVLLFTDSVQAVKREIHGMQRTSRTVTKPLAAGAPAATCLSSILVSDWLYSVLLKISFLQNPRGKGPSMLSPFTQSGKMARTRVMFPSLNQPLCLENVPGSSVPRFTFPVAWGKGRCSLPEACHECVCGRIKAVAPQVKLPRRPVCDHQRLGVVCGSCWQHGKHMVLEVRQLCDPVEIS